MINQVLQEVTAYTDERDYAKHQVVYRNGAPTRGFFYVKSGLIGLYQTTESGKESLLRIYGPGYFFGYRSLFTKQDYRSTARAMLPSELLQVNLSTFTELDSVSSNLSGFLVRGVCYELGEAENRLTQMTSNSAKVRIMDAIYHLFDNHPEYQWTYREVGEYSGTDTTTVIRFCKELKGMGILDSGSRKLQVSSIDGLKAYRDELASD
ncbi:cAMP-binding proteins [Vibrio ishigakensis]|uniref:cAMP-binding proteins n=1 Tax=Vibrio ishigakensis TaxID=1481914 RepID=A0A0B8Q8Q2_9VIBR|nr:cAMP-binding proteins [Vibrio ishigakensis]